MSYNRYMLWIVGPVAADYREYLNRHKIPFGQFSVKPSAADIRPFVTLEVSNKSALLSSLGALPSGTKVSGIMVTGMEQFVMPAAIIAEYFGVPGMSLQAATAATDKVIMRQRFSEHCPEFSPAFQEVNQWDDIEDFFKTYGGPVMLKPANLMKSLYVTKSDSLPELKTHYQEMLQSLPAIYSKNFVSKPKIIIERFMQGTMHTVAGFVNNKGVLTLINHVTDCISAREYGIFDSYLYDRSLPTQLSVSQEAQLFAAAEAGTAALGLTNTPIHAELILTHEGPKIIEIGARTGGFRPRMYEQAYGINVFEAALNCYMSRPVNISEHKQQASTVLEVFPETDGVFIELENAELLGKLTTLVSFKLKAKQGQAIGRASSGFRAAIVVNLAGSLQQVNQDKQQIRKFVRVKVKSA